MGWFCRCRTKGASLLETKWCMAKSVVKLCSLKWWHNEWYNTFFYRNLLKVHPPEKKCQHWPWTKDIRFCCCHVQPVPWVSPVCFSPGFSPEVCALQNWPSSDHHVRCFCYSVPKNGRLVESWRSGFFVRFVLPKWAESTLLGTNISPKNGILKMIFLFPRWDMVIPWRVLSVLLGLEHWLWKNHVSDSTSHYIVKSPDWWNTFSSTQMVWFPFNPQTGLFGTFSHAPCTLVCVPFRHWMGFGLISCAKKTMLTMMVLFMILKHHEVYPPGN